MYNVVHDLYIYYRRMIPLRNDTDKFSRNIHHHVEEYTRHLQAFQQAREFSFFTLWHLPTHILYIS